MPIYAYKCSACGHARMCCRRSPTRRSRFAPSAARVPFKQVTAAGFQLKGSGWYVTDFRGNGSGGASTSAPSESAAPAAAPATPAAPAAPATPAATGSAAS